MGSPASGVRTRVQAVPSASGPFDQEERLRHLVREELDRSMPFLVRDSREASPVHDPRTEAQVVANVIARVVTPEEIEGLESEHFFSAHLGALFAVAAYATRAGERFDHAAYVLACQRAGSGSFEVQGALLHYLDTEVPVCLEPGTHVLVSRILELASWRSFFEAMTRADHEMRSIACHGASVAGARSVLKSNLDEHRARLTVALSKVRK